MGRRGPKVAALDLSVFERLSRQDMVNILGFGPTVISGYVERGAPRNPDGSYNLKDFIRYLLTKVKDRTENTEITDIEKQLKIEQTEKVRLHNEQTRGNLVPVSMVDEILGTRAQTAAGFFRQSLKENAHTMEMKKREELFIILDEIAIRTMEVYIGDKKGG